MDSSICRASELRALVAELSELPAGATVSLVQLRDGREGELRWPLMAARPDLRVQVVSTDPGGLLVAPTPLAEALCSTPVTHLDLSAPGPGAYVLRR
jgi:hypothetical protein